MTVPSSISNSDSLTDRSPYQLAASTLSPVWWLCIAGLLLTLLGSLELGLRSAGYSAGPHDDDLFWASHRLSADQADSGTIVFIGSSRCQSDVAVPQLKSSVGRHVIQLAIAGSSPLPVLQDLADASDFSGTVCLSISPQHAFSSRDEKLSQPRSWISASKRVRSSPSEFWEMHCELAMRRFVLMRQDFNWRTVMNRRLSGSRPPEKDVWLQASRWTKIPDPVSRRRVGIEVEIPPIDRDLQNFENLVKQYQAAIHAIQARGGRVLVIQPPSTGSDSEALGILDTEKEFLPRRDYFDHLVSACGIQGLHADDFEQTRDLVGVDGSHLCESDARLYTEWLAGSLTKLMDSPDK